MSQKLPPLGNTLFTWKYISKYKSEWEKFLKSIADYVMDERWIKISEEGVEFFDENGEYLFLSKLSTFLRPDGGGQRSKKPYCL